MELGKSKGDLGEVIKPLLITGTSTGFGRALAMEARN
jgi:NADP-dependent 3-hydroxy acid dehydrogenase YdfG